MVNCNFLRIANLLDVPSKDQSGLAFMEIRETDVARSRSLIQDAIDS